MGGSASSLVGQQNALALLAARSLHSTRLCPCGARHCCVKLDTCPAELYAVLRPVRAFGTNYPVSIVLFSFALPGGHDICFRDGPVILTLSVRASLTERL